VGALDPGVGSDGEPGGSGTAPEVAELASNNADPKRTSQVLEKSDAFRL